MKMKMIKKKEEKYRKGGRGVKRGDERKTKIYVKIEKRNRIKIKKERRMMWRI